ncbi:hypothetical protein KR032_010984, partial [Drosophila birchii]
MEIQHLMEVLRATIDPILKIRRAAEHQLHEMYKIAGFAPTILQIVMEATVDQPVRQAGAVYLKHLIRKCWADYKAFSLYEQDREIIRGVIMDAIVHAPELIRAQLSMCMNHIIDNDFPGRWPQMVSNIAIYLQNEDVNGWNGALVIMYELVKIYEYKHKNQTPMYEAMSVLLPMIYQLMVRLLTEQSVQSMLLQKQILKIYSSLTRYSLPLEFITKEIFSQWMEICLHIADCEVPDSSHLNDDERTEFPYWKTKKWALHIMLNIFKRYGSPRNTVSDKYLPFAEWYLPTFSQDVLKVLMKILDQYRNQVYVSPRVLSDVLQYLRRAVCHGYTWKLIKSYMEAIIQEVIFPIMSFSKSDQVLWDTDPCEFIRLKFDNFSDYATPVPAAHSLLLSICQKRKGILPKAISAIIHVITSPDADNNQKDGALHMTGTLADLLLKKALYCNQIESLLSTYVLPEFQNRAGHMRARACWVLHCFCEIQFKNPKMLAGILQLTINALLTDKELPVKVQAAIGLYRFISSQYQAEQYVVDQIIDITKELLSITRETEIEDLSNVMQGIVCTFTKQLLPMASEICQHLAITFNMVIGSENESNENIQTAWSLLSTFDTLLSAMEEHPDALVEVQTTVTNLVTNIFQHNITDFYGITFELVYDLTTKAISPEMWQMLELIYQVFKKDGIDYFANIMPALHNYVTVDTPSFLSNPNRLYAIIDMCQTVLTSCPGDNPEWYAAKLMEVLILQCKGQIDGLMHIFVEISLSRLRREIQSAELRTMCLQVVIAALFNNPQLLLSILEKMSQQSNELISAHFIRQWLQDTEFFLGIHDRKLCVLGLCTLISLGDAKPEVLYEVADKIMPALIMLFDGLNRAYKSRAQEEEEEEEDGDIDFCDETLTSDEDDMDEMGLEETTDEEYEIDSEVFTTSIDDVGNEMAIDEYWTFKEVITALSAHDQDWYALLTSNLTPEQGNGLHSVVMIADQRKAAKDLKLAKK